MMDYDIRALAPEDEPSLWPMLMHAAHESSLTVVKENPDLARYVQGWGRAGDTGMIAVRQANGEKLTLGAAWLRLWANNDTGYGFVNAETPELAIAVLPDCRAQGIGTQLLKRLIATAHSQFPAISLSIREDNPALNLYQRLGFVRMPNTAVTNRAGSTSFTMLLQFED